jgi:hypothetical protein
MPFACRKLAFAIAMKSKAVKTPSEVLDEAVDRAAANEKRQAKSIDRWRKTRPNLRKYSK